MNNNEIKYKGNVILKNSTLSLGYKGISMILSLISSPLLLNILGNYKYGVYTSALSIVSWIYYFDLGIGNGLRFKVTEFISKSDYDSARKTVTVSYIMVSVVMMFLVIIIGILSLFFDTTSFFGIEIKSENLNVILLISIILASINFVFSLVNNILLATQESSKVNFFSLLGQVFFIIGLIFYIKWGISLIIMISFAEGGAQLLKNIIETIYVFKRYPKLKPGRGYVDFYYSKGIMSFGLKMFAIQMASLVLNSTDNLLILKLFGAEAVTPYSFIYKYFGIINTVFTIIIGPVMSAYTMAYAKKDYNWIKKTFKRLMILFVCIMLGTIIAACIFRPFSRIWLRKNMEFDGKLIWLTCFYFIMLMFSHNFSTFVNGIGSVNETTIAVILEAVLNIPLSIFLAKGCGMGVNGIIMGSILCICFVNIIYPYITVREFRKMSRC